jgi:primosomal protein N''
MNSKKGNSLHQDAEKRLFNLVKELKKRLQKTDEATEKVQEIRAEIEKLKSTS